MAAMIIAYRWILFIEFGCFPERIVIPKEVRNPRCVNPQDTREGDSSSQSLALSVAEGTLLRMTEGGSLLRGSFNLSGIQECLQIVQSALGMGRGAFAFVQPLPAIQRRQDAKVGLHRLEIGQVGMGNVMT